MNRRKFLANSLYGSLLCMIPFKSYSFFSPQADGVFQHGIASGDPTQDAVIIWTRISAFSDLTLTGTWEVATTPSFRKIVAHGTFHTNAEKDYTVKIDVQNLTPNTIYFYRFTYQENTSEIGTCKTLPTTLEDKLTVAVVSCNNYEDGYFNSFRDLALQDDVSYVLHLGDYIYEYQTLGYANKAFVEASKRVNDPLHEIVTLADYRKRFSLYRSDKDLQHLHQQKAFFCMWDDHEFANDTYVDGAKNHQVEEGKWIDRKQAALQAYFEWMPVRATTVQEMIRKISIGKDCQLYFLEERLDGRDKQGENVDSPDRKLLSTQQFNWLESNLKDDSVRWHLIVNQVMFTGYDLTDRTRYQRPDWWTGYPAQRQQLMDVFATMKNPPVILTGDHHQAHVLTLEENSQDKPLAWEFLTPSITSKNDDRLSPKKLKAKYEDLSKHNPHLKYSNTHDHGYYLLHLTKDNLYFDYRFNTNILVPASPEVQGPIFKITSNNKLIANV